MHVWPNLQQGAPGFPQDPNSRTFLFVLAQYRLAVRCRETETAEMGWPLACRSHPGERSNLLIDTTSSALAFHFGVFTFFRRTPEALLKFFPSFFLCTFCYFPLIPTYLLCFWGFSFLSFLGVQWPKIFFQLWSVSVLWLRGQKQWSCFVANLMSITVKAFDETIPTESWKAAFNKQS